MKTILQILILFLIVSQAIFTQWFQQTSGTPGNLYAVSFTDVNTGTAVGEGILRTTDGGTNWFNQTSPVMFASLEAVSFYNSDYGAAVGVFGDDGIILGTTDGGTTWTEQTPGTIYPLYGICYPDVNTGTAVGKWGLILRTTDGGTTWTEQTSGTQLDLHGVSFTDSDNGTAVGVQGTILRTTDGGTTWIEQTIGAFDILFGVSFTDSNNGTAVGSFGTILRTTDGGTTWTEQTSGTTLTLYEVSFTDPNTGTIVGDVGIIFRTTDGGTTWLPQTSGTTSWLNGVSFTDSDNGTAVGMQGTILRTTNGGVSFVEEEELNEIPFKYSLSDNFPDPFNPSTKIRYSIPQSSNVVIRVFDILGNEIETLVNEQKQIGTYELTWAAQNLPSGIYLYQLIADNFVETKKMVLIK